jgi:SAM-dependent methyltransferase
VAIWEFRKMPEFDNYVESYIEEVNESIKFSGEDVNYFAEYKVKKVKEWLGGTNEFVEPTILDFGCGLGLTEMYFEKNFPRSILYGIDVSPKSINFAQKLPLSNAHFYVYDGQKLPFKAECFDIIFTAGTFHHVPRDKHTALMREIKRVLNINGFLFLFELNRFNPIVRYISNKSRFDENANLLYPNHIKQTLREVGFHDVQLKFLIFFPGFLKRFRFFEKYLARIPIGAQYCFISKKQRD